METKIWNFKVFRIIFIFFFIVDVNLLQLQIARSNPKQQVIIIINIRLSWNLKTQSLTSSVWVNLKISTQNLHTFYVWYKWNNFFFQVCSQSQNLEIKSVQVEDTVRKKGLMLEITWISCLWLVREVTSAYNGLSNQLIAMNADRFILRYYIH